MAQILLITSAIKVIYWSDITYKRLDSAYDPLRVEIETMP